MRRAFAISFLAAFSVAVFALCMPSGGVRAGEILSQAYIDELNLVTVGDDRKREEPPAVDKPAFIPMTDAGLYMEPQDVVFVEEPEDPRGQVYIYPQNVLVQHEVVNLRNHGRRRSITYAPLTGSVVGIYAKATADTVTAFGTMGMLVNSNRMLYDRATNSLCPQILDTCIKGPLRNRKLSRFPLLWSTWRYVSKQYPHALVLSKNTGWRRNYGRDPYGSYARRDTYYQKGIPSFPVAHRDNLFPPKASFIALADGEAAVAVSMDQVRKAKVASMKLEGKNLVALYDPAFDAARMYRAHADGRELTFDMADGDIVDLETRTRWSVRGVATSGRLRGARLERLPAVPCMWFAWKAFHPYTRVWRGNGGSMFSSLPTGPSALQ